MKKLIIVMLLISMCLISGCDDEEIIQLDDIKTSTEIETEVAIDNEEMAENDENSRPFVVFVTGEVNNPGVYELDEGSRVIDAIVAAGGYTNQADENYVNLASRIQDEEMLYIPSINEVEEMKNGESTDLELKFKGNTSNKDEKSESSELININKASKEELMTLPGIGESKAEKIISYREQNGGFNSTEDIMQISGIKDGMYNKIKDRICAK